MKLSDIIVTIKNYDPLLRRYATMITGDQQLASEIVLKVFESLPAKNLKPGSSKLRPYLHLQTKLFCQQMGKRKVVSTIGKAF